MPYLRNNYGLVPSEVAARIKAERERLGLSQAEAARRTKVHRNTYLELELTANPQASKLLGLKQAGFDLRNILPELYDVISTDPN